MTQVTGTISAVRQGKPAQTQHGTLNVFYVDIESPQGNVEGGNLRAKSYEPKVGESITVEVRQGDYGPLLKRITDYQQTSTQPASNGKQRSYEDREQGMIIGWAHTLAAFELAHNLQHAQVAARAEQILADRDALGASSSAPTGPSVVPKETTVPPTAASEGGDTAPHILDYRDATDDGVDESVPF